MVNEMETGLDISIRPSFFFFLIVGVVVAQWAFSGSSSNGSTGNRPGSSNTSDSRPAAVRRYHVTQEMIDRVRAIAPDLENEQIRYDLQVTGSVQATVERYLSGTPLPFPPGYRRNTTTTNQNQSSTASKNLLDQFGIDKDALSKENDSLETDKPLSQMAWKSSREERQEQLRRRQQEMVLRARKKLLEKEKEQKEG